MFHVKHRRTPTTSPEPVAIRKEPKVIHTPDVDKSRPKTRDRTPKGIKRGTAVPQKHGGTLVVGAGHGPPKGEGGRPPSYLRDRLRGTLAERIPLIEQIADGRPVKEAEIPLLSVLRYAECPKCQGELKKLAEVTDADVVLITLRGRESATPNDRIKALDLAAKYGLGTKDEVTLISPDVRARVEAQVALIATRTTWSTADLFSELDKIWS